MTFDRSKFKAAKTENNKAAEQTMKNTMRSSTPTKRGDYHSLDEGFNYFRIMPPHDAENEPSWQPKVVYWLQVLVDELDSEGNPTSKKERKSRPIFDSRVHGGTLKDIVDEYINFTRKAIYDSTPNKDDAKKRLSPIMGYRDSKQVWHSGITASSSFVCYATKNGIIPDNLGRLEVYSSDKDKIEELNIDENSSEPIMTDNFSDPEDGVELVIQLAKNDKNKYERTFKKREASIKGKRGKELTDAIEQFQESQRVPDDVLESLLEMTSLAKMFKGAYKRSDFERALEALQYFDEQNNYNSFQNDEFLDIVEEIDGYYSESDPDENSSTVDDSTQTPKELTELDILDSTREELKSIIEQRGLKIRVTASITTDALREAVIEALFPVEPTETDPEPATDLPWEKEGGNAKSESQETKSESQETKAEDQKGGMSTVDRLRARRSKQ